MSSNNYLYLKTLCASKFEINNESHLKCIKSILDDTDSDEYLGHIPLTCSNDLFNSAYIIIDHNQNIGFFSIAHRIERNNIVATTLYYGIHPDFRKAGYATKMLNEISDFLLNHKLVDLIILNINRKNIGSIKAAFNSNYYEVPEFSDSEDIQFHRK